MRPGNRRVGQQDSIAPASTGHRKTNGDASVLAFHGHEHALVPDQVFLRFKVVTSLRRPLGAKLRRERPAPTGHSGALANARLRQTLRWPNGCPHGGQRQWSQFCSLSSRSIGKPEASHRCFPRGAGLSHLCTRTHGRRGHPTRPCIVLHGGKPIWSL